MVGFCRDRFLRKVNPMLQIDLHTLGYLLIALMYIAFAIVK